METKYDRDTEASYFSQFSGELSYETTVDEQFGKRGLKSFLKKMFPGDKRDEVVMRLYHQKHMRRTDETGNEISSISELGNGNYEVLYDSLSPRLVDGNFRLFVELNAR